MQSKPDAPSHLYEYAVIRYVPDIEREEFINVGLIMMCKRRRWLKSRLKLDSVKLAAFGASGRLDDIENQLRLFSEVTSPGKPATPICAMEAEERFRWLTAVKSCGVQTSRPHPGKTADLDATFDRLFATLVE